MTTLDRTKPRDVTAGMLAPNGRLSFGMAIKRLRALLLVSSADARAKLQDLLIDGELSAFVVVPGKKPRDVTVPCAYWAGVKTKRFASVALRKGSASSGGAYSLRLNEIAEGAADSLRPVAQGDAVVPDDAFFSALEELVAGSRRMLEVYLKQNTFDQWIERSGRDPNEQYRIPAKKNRGRPSSEWEPVLESLAIILANLVRSSETLPKVSSLADQVHKMAKDRGNNIPASKTIEGKIAKLINPQ